MTYSISIMLINYCCRSKDVFGGMTKSDIASTEFQLFVLYFVTKDQVSNNVANNGKL